MEKNPGFLCLFPGCPVLQGSGPAGKALIYGDDFTAKKPVEMTAG
jgi:hypothetical protein